MTTLLATLLVISICGLIATIIFVLRGRDRAIGRIANDVFKSAQEQFLTLAQEKLEGHRQGAVKDLEHKREMIEKMVEEIRRDLVQTRDKLKTSDDARIATFASIAKELEMQKSVVSDLRASTEDLKRVLSNNQLRGAFGEQVAENLLKMAGFVPGTDYVFNREQEHTDTRPDFTIFLPDRTRVNVDVKFPYAALLKLSSTDDRTEKEQHLRQFTADVKQKIKQVTTRGYINPEGKTVDFVILFIPNEMIFSFIYDQLNDVWEEGMQKKVIFAGPFSFTAILRMIKQAHSNFTYQENLSSVIGLIQKFETEYEKFSDSLDMLGERLESTRKAFDAVSGTRSRTLTRVVDQIKNQNILPESASESVKN